MLEVRDRQYFLLGYLDIALPELWTYVAVPVVNPIQPTFSEMPIAEKLISFTVARKTNGGRCLIAPDDPDVRRVKGFQPARGPR